MILEVDGGKHGFQRILLCAKFNRFFIILGGGSKSAKNHDFGGFGGPIYWDFGQKITKNPDTPSSFFEVFFGSDIRGIGPDIRGKWGISPKLGQNRVFFTYFTMCKI